MRSNNSRDATDQEPWVWGPEVEAACRRALELRYRLLPYFWTLLAGSHATGSPMLRPLWWDHQCDPRARRRLDQAFVGADLMVAPVLAPGVCSREVWLPPGHWYDWHTGERHRGDVSLLVAAPLDGPMPLFARAGAIVPTAPLAQCTEELRLDPLVLEVFPDEGGRAEGELYEDDGSTYRYEEGELRRTRFQWDGSGLRSSVEGTFDPGPGTVLVRLHGDRTVEEIDLGQRS
jgi:alpha-glucosidase